MNREQANVAATVLGVLGTLFMLVMAFGLFFENRMVPLFLGVACYIIAGAVRRMAVR